MNRNALNKAFSNFDALTSKHFRKKTLGLDKEEEAPLETGEEPAEGGSIPEGEEESKSGESEIDAEGLQAILEALKSKE